MKQSASFVKQLKDNPDLKLDPKLDRPVPPKKKTVGFFIGSLIFIPVYFVHAVTISLLQSPLMWGIFKLASYLMPIPEFLTTFGIVQSIGVLLVAPVTAAVDTYRVVKAENAKR